MSQEAGVPAIADDAVMDDKFARLGGRLPLLAPEELDAAQKTLHDRIMATRVARASHSGFSAATPDERLIGPFNSMLRAPEISEPLLDWTEAISAAPIPGQVREAVILTVAAQWPAAYVRYAHTRAAARAGLPEQAVAALAAGTPVDGADSDVELAQRITTALVRDHSMPGPLYAEAIDAFGEQGVATLVNLAGQYSNTCMLVTCFAVPAPQD